MKKKGHGNRYDIKWHVMSHVLSEESHHAHLQVCEKVLEVISPLCLPICITQFAALTIQVCCNQAKQSINRSYCFYYGIAKKQR